MRSFQLSSYSIINLPNNITFKMADSEVTSYEMNFIKKAGTWKAETLVSEKAECSLAVCLVISFLEWASLINRKESFLYNWIAKKVSKDTCTVCRTRTAVGHFLIEVFSDS